MNRWYASAAGALGTGVAIAFFVVPFDDGACPTAADACWAYGSAPRIGTVIVTALVALMLAAIGSAGASGRRLR
jgi:hypothetical protein